MKSVWLLYEGDSWLSTSSLVLMDICTTMDSLKANAEKLIAERGAEHLRTARDNGMDFDNKQEVCDDICLELLSHGATSGWATNYCVATANLDELGEI